MAYRQINASSVSPIVVISGVVLMATGGLLDLESGLYGSLGLFIAIVGFSIILKYAFKSSTYTCSECNNLILKKSKICPACNEKFDQNFH